MGKEIFWTRMQRKTKHRRNPGYKCSDIKILVPTASGNSFAVKEIIPITSAQAHRLNPKKKLPEIKLVSNERQGERYDKWRKAILSRDDYKCVLCDSKERIEAHHIIRWVDDERSRYSQKNGVALCYECHQKGHNYNKEPFPITTTSILYKYIDFRYDRARLNKVPRVTITDYNVDQSGNSRTNKTGTG